MPEIIRQADEYGLDAPPREPVPAPEHVAELLKAPSPWAGPLKMATDGLDTGLRPPTDPVDVASIPADQPAPGIAGVSQ